MNCRNIIFLSVLYVFLPAWIGFFWVELLQIAGRWNRFLHAWTLGFTTMLAAAQAVLVPLVATKQTLTSAMILWQMILNVLALISFWRVLKCWKQRGLAAGTADTATAVPSKTERSAGGARAWTFTFGVLAAVLILLQAYIPARYEHRDDDDSRFVSEEVSAVEHDTMYQDDPIAGDFLYWNEGEVKKDFTSPWAMYVAIGSRLSGIPPAVLSHTYLPFFLILLCYAVYFLIGQVLLRGDVEKVFLFLIFLSVIHLWGYTSTHTLASMLLLRIWQGKAVCASFMLPMLFYLLYQIMRREYKKSWIALLFAADAGACLLSGIGIVTAPVVIFLYGLVDFIYHRAWKKTVVIWAAALPSILCLLYYMVG
ncbi:MAG: DUF6077 domain-containing protein [Roseburia sp.]